jgi:transcriptional regulator with XRE-family HTH domain
MSDNGFLREQFQDPEYLRLHQQEKLILDVTVLISEAMESRCLTRADLARRLGVTRGYVTQILKGDANLTLRSVADVMTSLDCQLEVSAAPLLVGMSVGEQWHVVREAEPTTEFRDIQVRNRQPRVHPDQCPESAMVA